VSVENPLWGAPRIHGELLKLGFIGHTETGFIEALLQKARFG
jgi:hypothetical protein